jgi:hypothetical protein
MPDVPDMIYRSLTISTGGREYSVWASELEPLLESILEDSMKRADDERWAKVGPFKLGRTWKVEEEVRENFMWRGSWFGMWTRRADSTPVWGSRERRVPRMSASQRLQSGDTPLRLRGYQCLSIPVRSALQSRRISGP